MNIHHTLKALLCLSLILGEASAEEVIGKTQTRCGWFVNPTPSNAWLNDRDGQWIIATQGGRQAEGDWPNFGASRWVETNGHYGYGCACIKAVVLEKTHEIDRIISSRVRPLSTCRKDRSLKKLAF
jgi:Protein of unknown function (DUF4087)